MLLLLSLLWLLHLMILQLTIVKGLCICHAVLIVLLGLIWVFAVTWRRYWTDLLISSLYPVLHGSRTVVCPSPSLHSISTRYLRFSLIHQSLRPLSFHTLLGLPDKPFHFPRTSISWGTNTQVYVVQKSP